MRVGLVCGGVMLVTRGCRGDVIWIGLEMDLIQIEIKQMFV